MNALTPRSTQSPAKPAQMIMSFWRERRSQAWSFFCPSCRASRRLPCRPRPGGIRHVSQVGLTSLVFTLACWKIFSWKGAASFIPLWTGFELVYRARIRAALKCSFCGFDPYLYLIDVKLARREIENHWRQKFAEKGVPFPEKPGSSAMP